MDRLMELTEYMVSRIKGQPDKFYLILEPELVNVCFWYVPRRLRSQRHDSRREEELGKVRILQNNKSLQTKFSKTNNYNKFFSRFAPSWRVAWCSRVHWWWVTSRMIVVPTSSEISYLQQLSLKRTSISCWTKWTDSDRICKLIFRCTFENLN